jgi:ketosteroid isomerase-like protein
MNSMAGPVDPQSDLADSRNVLLVKELYEILEEQGIEAGIERLLAHAHPDFEFRPYVAEGRVLKGADEVRAFYRDQLATGTTLKLRSSSVEEHGDEVVVYGSLRVARAAGGFLESQISWTYRFRDGLLEEVYWSPRQAA